MSTTHYTWDELSDNVLLESDASGSVESEYTTLPDRYGETISQLRSNATYFNYDGEGSTRQLTDDSEEVTDSFDYSAYGTTVNREGSTSAVFQFRGASGFYSNDSTDNIYVRRRTYHPATGRWLSIDPVGFVDGPNRYRASFVPNGSDPSGLICLPSDPPVPLSLSPDPHGPDNDNWRPQPAGGYPVDLQVPRGIIRGCTCCYWFFCCTMDLELHVRAYRYYRHNEDDRAVSHDDDLIGVSNDPRDFFSLVIVDVCRTNIVCCDTPIDEEWKSTHRSSMFYRDGRGTYIRQGEGDIETTAKDFPIPIDDPMYLEGQCCSVALDLLKHLEDNVVPGEVDG